MRSARLISLSGFALACIGLSACDLVPTEDPPRLIDSEKDDKRVISGDPTFGRDLIRQIECGVCHDIPGIPGADGIVGPPLDSFARRQFIAGVVPNRPTILVRFIQNAPSIVPNTAMPNLPISDADARHIAAYLYTLR